MLPIIIYYAHCSTNCIVYAATFEMKQIDMIVVDQDLSTVSRRLVSKFEGSPFFYVNSATF